MSPTPILDESFTTKGFEVVNRGVAERTPCSPILNQQLEMVLLYPTGFEIATELILVPLALVPWVSGAMLKLAIQELLSNA